jgi:hypothetical protein
MILPLSVTSTFFFILNVRKIRPTSMAHKGNHICLHRFSFIYVMDDL